MHFVDTVNLAGEADTNESTRLNNAHLNALDSVDLGDVAFQDAVELRPRDLPALIRLADMELDEVAIAVGLLHDLLEDTQTTAEEWARPGMGVFHRRPSPDSGTG